MTARCGKRKEKEKKVDISSTFQVEEGVRGYECT
jgi:hypothetical protein